MNTQTRLTRAFESPRTGVPDRMFASLQSAVGGDSGAHPCDDNTPWLQLSSQKKPATGKTDSIGREEELSRRLPTTRLHEESTSRVGFRRMAVSAPAYKGSPTMAHTQPSSRDHRSSPQCATTLATNIRTLRRKRCWFIQTRFPPAPFGASPSSAEWAVEQAIDLGAQSWHRPHRDRHKTPVKSAYVSLAPSHELAS